MVFLFCIYIYVLRAVAAYYSLHNTPMPQFEFGVEMSCEGCANAVNRVLGRLDGIQGKEISLSDQKVLVDAAPNLTVSQVHDAIAKTGKKIVYETVH